MSAVPAEGSTAGTFHPSVSVDFEWFDCGYMYVGDDLSNIGDSLDTTTLKEEVSPECR